ncbi:MAG: alpha/beta fold hydrolase [Bacteroidia bacterium]
MQNIFSNKLTIIAIALLALIISSCSKEEINLNELDETIYVRHKNADMPAYIHGNASEKVFLIILHGGPGGTGLSYRVNAIRNEVEKNNAVVYFDQRGSGNAQGQYSEEDISIDLMAEDVLALAKVIRTKFGDDSKLFLMGHSWGGTLGPAVLLKNQDEFLGWIDLDGAHNHADFFDEYRAVLTTSANEQIALGNSVDYWQNVLDQVQEIGPTNNTINQLRLNSITNTTAPILIEDNIINEYRRDFGNDHPKEGLNKLLWNQRLIGNILDFQKGLGQVSFKDSLPKITIPSLVLWGKHDYAVPLVFAHEAYDNLGSSDKELFIFERSGHCPHLSEPDLLGDKLIEFINKHK